MDREEIFLSVLKETLPKSSLKGKGVGRENKDEGRISGKWTLSGKTQKAEPGTGRWQVSGMEGIPDGEEGVEEAKLRGRLRPPQRTSVTAEAAATEM